MSQNPYSSIVKQHPNWIIGTLQLFLWILFQPSAWRKYMEGIDSDISPNFCLLQLTRSQRSNPEIYKLLLQGYGLLPVLSILSLLILNPHDPEKVLTTLAGALGFSLIASLGISVAFGITVLVPAGVVDYFFNKEYETMLICLVIIAIGMTVGWGTSPDSPKGYSLARQTQGVAGGIMITGLIGFIIGFTWETLAVRFVPNFADIRSDFLERPINEIFIFIFIATLLCITLAVTVRFKRLTPGLFLGLLLGILTALTLGNAPDSIANNLARGLIFGAIYTFPYAIGEKIAGPIIGHIAASLFDGTLYILSETAKEGDRSPTIISLGFLGLFIGLNFLWIRTVLMYPLITAFNTSLYHFDRQQFNRQGHFFRFHSAFWDEFQFLPLIGLDRHLLLMAEKDRSLAEWAIDFLSTHRQAWASQAVQIEIDARQIESYEDIHAIAHSNSSVSIGDVEGPASALFHAFNRISEDIRAALQQSSSYHQRLALTSISDRLNDLLRELTRSRDKYATRFRPIAQKWNKIVQDSLQVLAESAELNQEIDCPYIIGVPLTQKQSIFVGRTDISGRIEYLIRDRQSPPLLLYGQRRMGKTSLLNNLGRLLPNSIVPLFVDLQGPASQASDHSGFLYNLARGMNRSARHQRDLSLPALSRDSLVDDPFTRFDEWLDEVEAALNGKTVLLALDEFEAFNQALTDGRYEETAILGMFRHLIQHRHQFKVLFSGSHALSEFQRWSSYLINAQVLHLSNLRSQEALQLIEHPIDDFPLQYQPEARDYVLSLTCGHPYLVQLLCTEIIFLKNEQSADQRRLVTLKDVELAIPEALASGSMFFSDIEHNQLTAEALLLLNAIANQGTRESIQPQNLHQISEIDDEAIALLQQRELIESQGDGYRIQIELIRRWFAKSPF